MQKIGIAIMPSADLSRWVDLCCSVIIFKPALDLCSLLLELAPDVGLTHSPAPVVCCGSGEVHACRVVQPHDVLHAQAVTAVTLCHLHAAMTIGNVAHFLKVTKLVKCLDVVLCILASLIQTDHLTEVSNLILCNMFVYCLCYVRMRWSVHSSQVCSTSQPCAEALYNVCATQVRHSLTIYVLVTTMLTGCHAVQLLKFALRRMHPNPCSQSQDLINPCASLTAC